MKNTFEFSLDIKRQSNVLINRVVSDDTAVVFTIHVTDNGEPVDLDTDYNKVLAVFRRADGAVYVADNAVAVSNSVVTVNVHPAYFSAGRNSIELQIYTRAQTTDTVYPDLITTEKALFNARKATLVGEGATAPSQLPMLEQIIVDAQTAVTNCNAAKTAANAAATNANEKASAANTAAANANDAASNANAKATTANSAATAANAAASNADAKATAANAAATNANEKASAANTAASSANTAASSANAAAAFAHEEALLADAKAQDAANAAAAALAAIATMPFFVVHVVEMEYSNNAYQGFAQESANDISAAYAAGKRFIVLLPLPNNGDPDEQVTYTLPEVWRQDDMPTVFCGADGVTAFVVQGGTPVQIHGTIAVHAESI